MSEKNTSTVTAELSRRQVLARAGLLGVGAAALSPVLSACGAGASDNGSGEGIGNFPETPAWTFVFVSHATTNSFFTPTVYGLEDAAAAFGVDHQWTGAPESDLGEMTRAMDAAIASGADGIAVSLIDGRAFTPLIERAQADGIPVVAFSSEAPEAGALSYTGTDNYEAGRTMGERIVQRVDSGEVALFAAEPGALYAVPRIQGAEDVVRESGKGITVSQVSSGYTINESVSRVDAYYQGHQNVKGMYGIDAYATQAVGQVIKDHDRSEAIRSGGYDALEPTLQLLDEGQLDFTIDEQPYLQGFYPLVQLFLYKLSGGQTGTANMNVASRTLEQADAGPFLENPSRFQGTSEDQKLIEAPA